MMIKPSKIYLTFVVFSLVTVMAACQSTVRKGVYSAYETVGIQKRDLLKRRVDDTREEQKEAGETFKDALTELQALYGFEGGELEKKYRSMKSAYEKAEDDAKDVRESIKQVETVAGDLFAEWEKEAAGIQTASLRSKSREQLATTQRRYNEMHASLKKSESRMEPVLAKFNDQVTYLKHNLNAQAIASLKGESANIQGEIERLIADMNKSIAEADQFIAAMK